MSLHNLKSSVYVISRLCKSPHDHFNFVSSNGRPGEVMFMYETSMEVAANRKAI